VRAAIPLPRHARPDLSLEERVELVEKAIAGEDLAPGRRRVIREAIEASAAAFVADARLAISGRDPWAVVAAVRRHFPEVCDAA